jgi:Tfp pilus assembly protein PilF
MHARSRIAQAFLFAITCAARCLPQPSHDDELAAQKTVGQAMDRVNALDNEGGLALLAEALRMNPDNFQAHYWTAFILR